MQAQVQENSDKALSGVGRLWKRRRWLGLPVFFVAFTAAASFVAALPDMYSATTTLMVNPQAPAQDGPGSGGQAQDSHLDAVTAEVESRDSLLTLIDRFNLYPTLRQRASADSVVQQMRQDIKVDRKAGQPQWGQDPTFGFTVSYQGWEPKQVADVTNALAVAFVNSNTRMRAQQASATLLALQSQISDIKRKLDAQGQRINSFRASHLGELPDQQATSLAMLQQLDSQLQQNAESLTQTQGLQQQRLAIQAAPDRAAGGVDAADLPQLEDQLATLRSRYTDQYPDVVHLKQQIAALKHSQQDQSSDQPPAQQPLQDDGTLDGSIRSYQDQDSKLRQEIAGYQARIENMPVREQQLASLTQGYTETQDVYSELLKRYEQVPSPQSPAGQYKILEGAATPTDSSGPGRGKLLLMCLVLSLGLAAVVVFLAEQLDASFHSIDELRAFSRVPVIANIPLIITRQDVWRSRLRFGAAALSILVAMFLVGQATFLLGHGNTTMVWMLSKHGTPSSPTSTGTSGT
ncbi:MAG TPA: hypothetical protein VGH71_00590 [Gammaproteobacteria bacterium]|jgi:polysaccharide chain length determinant protein (PEP-CTERM system associated)